MARYARHPDSTRPWRLVAGVEWRKHLLAHLDGLRSLLGTGTTAGPLTRLAAASSGAVDARRFEGGNISIHPSRVPGQIYVILRFSWPTNAPRMMLLESAEGHLVKRALPSADSQGEVMMVLNERSDADAGFLRLLTDPTSTGTFVL